jgi:hypothetical protein
LCTGLPYGGEVEDMYSSDYSDTDSEKGEEKAVTNTPRLEMVYKIKKKILRQ